MSLYAWLWRHLPGTVAVKVVTAVILVAVVVVTLFVWVFPWVQAQLPIDTTAADQPQPTAPTHR